MTEAFLKFDISGNPLWRIMVLFGIILIGLILGRIARFAFRQSSKQFENKGRLLAATTLDAVARGVLFLCASLSISVGLAFLGLKARVAEIFGTISAILMSVGIGYFGFNTEVFCRFKEEGIEFGFPTQTLFLAGDPMRPLNVGVERVDEASPA